MNISHGGTPYALGNMIGSRFHIRRIVFGKLMASYERRPHEEVRGVRLIVSQKTSRPLAIETIALKRIEQAALQP